MALTVTTYVSDGDLAIIAYDVIDPEAWCREALSYVIRHKIEQCQERLLNQNEQLLGDVIPKDRRERAAAIIAAPGYRSRKQRDPLAVIA